MADKQQSKKHVRLNVARLDKSWDEMSDQEKQDFAREVVRKSGLVKPTAQRKSK